MQAAQILERADALFAKGLGAEAAALLEQNYEQAGQEGDWQTRLTLVNELMGYYRSISRLDRAWAFADEARQLLEEHGLTLFHFLKRRRAFQRPSLFFQRAGFFPDVEPGQHPRLDRKSVV